MEIIHSLKEEQRVISLLDDYSIHQTPDYIRIPATGSKNFYDRYFFLGYQKDAQLMFGVSWARYPNRNVEDAHFTVVHKGVQSSFHASQALSSDPSTMRIGPLSLEIIEPMNVLRFTLEENPDGLSCELNFKAVTGAIDEGRTVAGDPENPHTNQTRFMQYGSWQGSITNHGEKIAVDKNKTYGLRDKSWGVRMMAENHFTPDKNAQVFWMNVVMHLGDKYSVIRTVDGVRGQPLDRAGYFAPIYSEEQSIPVGEKNLREVKNWTSELKFKGDTRQVIAGVYDVEFSDGEKRKIYGTAIGTLWYGGMGYNHERWNHALDHGGPLVTEREDWVIDDIDMALPERQFLASVLVFKDEQGNDIGFGHTEQFLMGPYEPYGWK